MRQKQDSIKHEETKTNTTTIQRKLHKPKGKHKSTFVCKWDKRRALLEWVVWLHSWKMNLKFFCDLSLLLVDGSNRQSHANLGQSGLSLVICCNHHVLRSIAMSIALILFFSGSNTSWDMHRLVSAQVLMVVKTDECVCLLAMSTTAPLSSRQDVTTRSKSQVLRKSTATL